MPSRKIEDLIPETQKLWKAFDNAMEAAGIEYTITATRRTQAEQDALYEQGRTKPGRIVTWTHHSKHIEGKAFDIVITKNGVAQWNDTASFAKAGVVGEGVGLEWGGRWKTPDLPHFQLKEK